MPYVGLRQCGEIASLKPSHGKKVIICVQMEVNVTAQQDVLLAKQLLLSLTSIAILT